MKYLYVCALMLSFGMVSYAQEEEQEITVEQEVEEVLEEGEPDTTTVSLGKRTVIVINNDDVDYEEDAEEEEKESIWSSHSEPHWAGVDFGFTLLTDGNYGTNFGDYPYWRTDAARSQVWNLNPFEHRFNLGTKYVGLTTGIGFTFASVAFNDNYILSETADTLTAMIDTTTVYSKNKLNASYLTVPLLLEISTKKGEDGFYLAAGVVGGVRLTSKVKRIGESGGNEIRNKTKGKYGLNPFKADATVRFGYGNWGAFASYGLVPLFDTNKTTPVHPFTFGLSLGF